MTEPPAALDPTSIIAAAKTFRAALRAFDHLVRKRPRKDRFKSWPPQDTLPVSAAAAALRRTLTPSDPGRLAWGDYYDVDVLEADNLTPAARLLLRKVWWKLGFVEEDALGGGGDSFALNLDADEWDVLLEDVLAALGPTVDDAAPEEGSDDAFTPLREFARDSLKGIERAVIESLCALSGEMPIADLAVKSGVNWRDTGEGFKSAQRRLNRKLKSQHWELFRQNNMAKLKMIKMTAKEAVLKRV
jgi:hypothetical protein